MIAIYLNPDSSLHPLSRSAQRLLRGRHHVPPGSTLRALTRGKSMRESSQQQRRAVRATFREERAGAAGDEEPETKSRASTYQQCRKGDQGDGVSGTDRREWSRVRSTIKTA